MEFFVIQSPEGGIQRNEVFSLEDVRRIAGDRREVVERPIALPVYSNAEVTAIARNREIVCIPLVMPWEHIVWERQGGRLQTGAPNSPYPPDMRKALTNIRVPGAIANRVKQYAIYLAWGGELPDK